MSQGSLLNDPEITRKIHELRDMIDAKAAQLGRSVETLAIIARDNEGNSAAIGGHTCPVCLMAMARTLVRLASGDDAIEIETNAGGGAHVH